MGSSYDDEKLTNDNTNSISHLNKTVLNWFPGHMMRALRKIKEALKSVDIVLEIRDARAPFVTGNISLKEQIGNKSHLIVINKMNLADPNITKLWKDWFETQNTPFIFVNGLDKSSLNKVVKKAREIVKQNHLKSNPDTEFKKKLRLMIVGLPNTGKSTIINKLSNRDASKVADKPGQTQQQLWVNVSKDLEILDTPGVMPPMIKTDEHALWLSAIHAIPERITDTEDTACCIVKHLLKYNPEALLTHYKLDSLANDLIEVLEMIAKKRGFIRKGNVFDYDRVYKILINDFRDGKLGPISFERPLGS